MSDLTTQEANMLDKCEKVIEKGKQTFYEVGTALKTVRDGKLYRAEHKTFEEYCRERWGWERTYAYSLIGSSTVMDNLSAMADKPANEKQTRPLQDLPAEEQREVWQEAVNTAPDGKVTAAHVAEVVAEHKEQKASEQEVKPRAPSHFNATNDNIEWAHWSWNPVTGCKTGCEYCYARDIADRFSDCGFEPTFHKERLEAPANTKPDSSTVGGRSVFVCSMADLFGSWVPNDWIAAVMKEVKDNPQWTFIFLTKNPRRYTSINFPDNAIVGTTVDSQKRVEAAETRARIKFVSCEPLLEAVTFNDLSIFQWLIIGGRSKTTTGPEVQPNWRWAFNLTARAEKAKCKVYWKPNLSARPREYPEGM